MLCRDNHLFCRLYLVPSSNLLSLLLSVVLSFFLFTEQNWSFLGVPLYYACVTKLVEKDSFIKAVQGINYFGHELDSRMMAVLAQSQACLVSNLTMATTGGPPYYPSSPFPCPIQQTHMHSHLLSIYSVQGLGQMISTVSCNMLWKHWHLKGSLCSCCCVLSDSICTLTVEPIM